MNKVHISCVIYNISRQSEGGVLLNISRQSEGGVLLNISRQSEGGVLLNISGDLKTQLSWLKWHCPKSVLSIAAVLAELYC